MAFESRAAVARDGPGGRNPPNQRTRIGATIQWQKNGRAIAGATSNPLVLAPVTSSDAGTYTAVNNDPVALGFTSQALVLGVGGTERLLNLSARGVVGPGGDQGLVSGFVVEASSQSKKLLLRAIGPTLALFDVPNPLRRPVLRIFDRKGQPYTNGLRLPGRRRRPDLRKRPGRFAGAHGGPFRCRRTPRMSHC